jgi:hypothetical protein
MSKRKPNPEPERHPDLFAVHEQIEAHGVQDALQASQDIYWTVENPRLAPVHKALSGRNGRRIADAASTAIIREHERGHELGYTYSAWCLAGLPHREHPTGEEWVISTDYAQLLVRPGIRVRDDGTTEALAVPSGTMARLLLIDLQSEALELGSRDIVLGPNPNLLINRLGLSRGGPVSRKLVDQLERICRCTLDFKFGKARGAGWT